MPLTVTARCDQVFSGSWPGRVSCCSPPEPDVVIPKRGPMPAPSIVRNMFRVVPVPKSKIRDQVRSTDGLTQTEIVKSWRLLTMPVGQR